MACQRVRCQAPVTDTTPSPELMQVVLEGNPRRWQADAGVESGLSYGLIEWDRVAIGTWPGKPSNPFGRHASQNLQCSDTPQLGLGDLSVCALPAVK
jgi:hypothetical protein